MRDIKFRAWDLDNTEMHFSDMEEEAGCNGSDLIVWIIDMCGLHFEEFDEWHEIVGGEDDIKCGYRSPNQVIMQATGLRDLRGVEIYEGDILKDRWDDSVYSISYYKNGFYLDDGLHSNWDETDFKVIGNIYENPELLHDSVKEDSK